MTWRRRTVAVRSRVWSRRFLPHRRTDTEDWAARAEEAIFCRLRGDRINELAGDAHPIVREAVAWRSDVAPDLRLRLACDANPHVSGGASAWLRSHDDTGCQIAGALAGPGMAVDDVLALVAAAGVESRLLGI